MRQNQGDFEILKYEKRRFFTFCFIFHLLNKEKILNKLLHVVTLSMHDNELINQ